MVDLGKNLLVPFSIAFQHEEELCCKSAPRKTDAYFSMEQERSDCTTTRNHPN
jgi:hypothetical protein